MWEAVSPLCSQSHSNSNFTPHPSSSTVTWVQVHSWAPLHSCHVTVRLQQENVTRLSYYVEWGFIHLLLIAVYNKSDSPQYHSSGLLSQAMVITDSSSLGTLTSLATVRQVPGVGQFVGDFSKINITA